MNTLKERVYEYIEYKGISVSQFEREASLSNGYVSAMRKGFGVGKLENVLNSFPDINRDWLLYGEGDMLISDSSTSISAGSYITDEEEYKRAQGLGMQIVPEYSDSFRGGNLGTMISTDSVTAYWGFPNLKASLVVEVDGDSMAPRYPSGSKVALRKIIFDKDHPTLGIPFGEVFALVVDSGDEQPLNFIKILRRHPNPSYSSKFWLAQSINREKYDDFEIEIDKVRHLFVVVAGVSLNRI